ncbi:MAG: hypothetical protein AAGJ40_17415 [Planctomycetota bacterium]
MLTDGISFFVVLGLAFAFATWFARRHGQQTALGAAMSVSLLAGTWFEIEILGTAINVPIATALIWLIIYCTHSGREIFSHLNVTDYLLGALMAWQIVVDTYHSGQPFSWIAIAYGRWMLPYAVGRYAFLSNGTLQKVSPLFAVVGGLIGLAAMVEAFSGVNLWRYLFCEIDDEVALPVYTRFGLTRAHGPMRHPIFLGVVLLTLIPFAIEWMTRSGIPRAQRILGAMSLAAIVLGIGATISRGPMLCVPLIALIVLAWHSRIARWTLAGATVVIGLVTVFNSDGMLTALESATNRQQRSRIIVLGDSDEAEVYSGTRNRLLAPRIYGPIFWKGGPLGYGTEASDGFPPLKLPGIPRDPELLKRVSIIDNSYLNIGLAFGWIGAGLFIGMLLSAIHLDVTQVPVAETHFYPTASVYFVTRAAVLLAAMAQLCLVYWDFDHGFWVMAFVGASAGLVSRKERGLVGEG